MGPPGARGNNECIGDVVVSLSMSLKTRISSASQSLIRKGNGGNGLEPHESSYAAFRFDFVVVVAYTESKKS